MDKVSDTPRTDASYVCHYGDGLGQWVPREFACELERELTAQKEHYRVLEEEMLVMNDERLCATLDAKENMEIANEFKHTMEEYRQRAEAAYKQSHIDAERYRWLRDDQRGRSLSVSSLEWTGNAKLSDAAVDAAMKEVK